MTSILELQIPCKTLSQKHLRKRKIFLEKSEANLREKQQRQAESCDYFAQYFRETAYGKWLLRDEWAVI
jgi:hypothetical protein